MTLDDDFVFRFADVLDEEELTSQVHEYLQDRLISFTVDQLIKEATAEGEQH